MDISAMDAKIRSPMLLSADISSKPARVRRSSDPAISGSPTRPQELGWPLSPVGLSLFEERRTTMDWIRSQARRKARLYGMSLSSLDSRSICLATAQLSDVWPFKQEHLCGPAAESAGPDGLSAEALAAQPAAVVPEGGYAFAAVLEVKMVDAGRGTDAVEDALLD